MEMVGQSHALVTNVQEAERASASVWIGAENFFPHEGFAPTTLQAIASRYTNYAIPAQQVIH
jgi:hypothetical protein